MIDTTSLLERLIDLPSLKERSTLYLFDNGDDDAIDDDDSLSLRDHRSISLICPISLNGSEGLPFSERLSLSIG